VNLGAGHPPPSDGLLTSIGWTVAGATTYVMEGSVFVTGAAIQWLRDGIGIIADAAEAGPLAASVPDTGGVMFVPAFTGLGSPWWDPYARGTIIGITRGTTRAHVARAVVEAMGWQTRDVVDAIVAASGRPVAELRADGGASVIDVLCQFQADVLGVTVRRPQVQQTTALGAAYLAGLATGVWATPADAASNWIAEAEFVPSMPADEVARGHAQWLRAVERSRGWAEE
jgi:glycerol kinase